MQDWTVQGDHVLSDSAVLNDNRRHSQKVAANGVQLHLPELPTPTGASKEAGRGKTRWGTNGEITST